MMTAFTDHVRELAPGILVSSPDAALYSVVDVREIAGGSFDALEFVMHCAAEGRVERDGKGYTLLTAPMAEFYDVKPGEPSPGRTQMRIAYVETPDRMALVPELLASLLGSFAGVGGVRR
jgi:aspartate aminotransferase